MKYILKKNVAEEIRSKYKNSYFKEKLGLSNSYVSLVLNRRRKIPRRTAYVFAKTLGMNVEVNDLFEQVK